MNVAEQEARKERAEEQIKVFGMNRSQKRNRRRAGKHTVELDPVRFKGYTSAATTAERPWDKRAANRKRNKAAKAARRKNR